MHYVFPFPIRRGTLTLHDFFFFFKVVGNAISTQSKQAFRTSQNPCWLPKHRKLETQKTYVFLVSMVSVKSPQVGHEQKTHRSSSMHWFTSWCTEGQARQGRLPGTQGMK